VRFGEPIKLCSGERHEDFIFPLWHWPAWGLRWLDQGPLTPRAQKVRVHNCPASRDCFGKQQISLRQQNVNSGPSCEATPAIEATSDQRSEKLNNEKPQMPVWQGSFVLPIEATPSSARLKIADPTGILQAGIVSRPSASESQSSIVSRTDRISRPRSFRSATARPNVVWNGRRTGRGCG
jgi:hypothetical protein